MDAIGRVPPAGRRHHPPAAQHQHRHAARLAVFQLRLVGAQAIGVEPAVGDADRPQHHLAVELVRPGRPFDPLDRLKRETGIPGALALIIEDRLDQTLEPGEKGRALADLPARLVGIDGVVGVRRPDIKLHAAGHDDVVDLAEPRPKVLPFRRGIAGSRHFHVVADHDIGAAAGQVGPHPTGEHAGIAQFHRPVDGELLARPLVGAVGLQPPRLRVAFDDPLDRADHLLRQRQIGRQHHDPERRIGFQQPGREQPDHGRFPAVAESHEQKPPVLTVPAVRTASRRFPDGGPGSFRSCTVFQRTRKFLKLPNSPSTAQSSSKGLAHPGALRDRPARRSWRGRGHRSRHTHRPWIRPVPASAPKPPRPAAEAGKVRSGDLPPPCRRSGTPRTPWRLRHPARCWRRFHKRRWRASRPPAKSPTAGRRTPPAHIQPY